METSAASQPRNEPSRAWINVMNAALAALEQTVWQGRELAEQALSTVKKIGKGAEDAKAEYDSLREEAARWPARVDRLKTTGWMLTRITSSYRLWGIKSAFIRRSKMDEALTRLHRRNAILFRDVSLQQGGAFLKVGQLLSARADILPKVWVEELRVLQDQANEVPFPQIRELIEAELGDSLENLFASFEPEPIAAASIGQVHRATLPDGRAVAVKVQRPGLEEIIELDMTLLKLFVESIRSLLPPTDFDTIVSEIQRSVREELDYRQEAHWMRHLGNFLDVLPHVVVPRPIDRYCTAKVMVSNFVVGTPLMTELDRRQAEGDQAGISELLGQLLDLYLRQVLQAGIFQADPHPGNLLVTPEGKLVLLDFGCTMQLSEAFRNGYFKVLGAALMDERETMADLLMNMGFKTRSGRPDTLLLFADALLSQIKQAASEMGKGNMQWPSAADILNGGQQLLAQAEQDPVEKMPAEFIMLARVFTTLGGLFVHYQPQLDVHTYLLPHLVGPAISNIW